MSNIITAADLNTYTGKTLDAGRATQVVDAVNAYIESVTGRVWGEVVTLTEVHDLATTTYLRHQDITEIVSVKTGRTTQTTLPTSSYTFTPVGRVSLFGRFFGGTYACTNALEVIYKTGYMDVPDDLKLAALGLAADYYNYAGSEGKDVSSTSVGSYSVTYRTGDSTSSGARNVAVIKRYKKVRV